MEKLFSKAVLAHEKILFKVCRMYCTRDEDQQDLFQEIMLQLWRAYPSFRSECKISTWMYRIAINTAIMQRKKKLREPLTDVVTAEIPEKAVGEDDQQYHEMMIAVEKLSPVEKAIVMLYLDDHSYKEMSEVIGISESNIGFKINAIKHKLRKLTNNEHGT